MKRIIIATIFLLLLLAIPIHASEGETVTLTPLPGKNDAADDADDERNEAEQEKEVSTAPDAAVDEIPDGDESLGAEQNPVPGQLPGVDQPLDSEQLPDSNQGENNGKPPDEATNEPTQGWPEKILGINAQELDQYLEEKVIPLIIVIVSALATIYIAVSPILSRVKKAVSRFHSATDTVTQTATDAAATKKANTALVEEMRQNYQDQTVRNEIFQKAMSELMSQVEASVTREVGEMKAEMSNAMQMMLIGFCNSRELVNRGLARQIALIAKEAGITVPDVTEQQSAESAQEEQDDVQEAGEEEQDDGEGQIEGAS